MGSVLNEPAAKFRWLDLEHKAAPFISVSGRFSHISRFFWYLENIRVNRYYRDLIIPMPLISPVLTTLQVVRKVFFTFDWSRKFQSFQTNSTRNCFDQNSVRGQHQCKLWQVAVSVEYFSGGFHFCEPFIVMIILVKEVFLLFLLKKYCAGKRRQRATIAAQFCLGRKEKESLWE